jgi:thioredoxin-like negative regulator of GroEL
MTDAPWASSGIEVLRTKDFLAQRLNRTGTYVVCFAAEWCPVTRRFMPKFVARKDALDGTLAIADITDTNDPLWDDFRIRITPSIVVFRDGMERTRIDGRRFIGITHSKMGRLEEGLRPGS